MNDVSHVRICRISSGLGYMNTLKLKSFEYPSLYHIIQQQTRIQYILQREAYNWREINRFHLQQFQRYQKLQNPQLKCNLGTN